MLKALGSFITSYIILMVVVVAIVLTFPWSVLILFAAAVMSDG